VSQRTCPGKRKWPSISDVVSNIAKPVTEKEGTSFEESGLTAQASSYTRNIRTLEDLLAYTKVDLSVWEVEKHVVNKWEVVMREPATTIFNKDGSPLISGKDGAMATLWTRKSRIPVHEQLYQIKAWLRRKDPIVRGTELLLKAISEKAPLLNIPSIRKFKLKQRRALEVCVMDPHIGLLCENPQADSPWNLKLSASMIMSAIDDLIDKTKTFGPFEQAFMPFGNDFVHSDNVDHTTTAGTAQPEAISWHKVYDYAERVAIEMVSRLRAVAKTVYIYEVPGNHSRMADFTLARLLKAYFRRDAGVIVDASSSPYKFHRFGTNLIGYEHGHSVKPIRLAALMAHERRQDWAETEYREFHLGDQHRKGSSKPSMLEEQGVSVDYIPGLVAPNEWHRLKAFNHQQRGAMAFVWDYKSGPIGRFQFNIGQYSNRPK
jgi:hypothetical protein